jgi:hypothetical protein
VVAANQSRKPLTAKYISTGARVIQAKLELFVQTSRPGFASIGFIVDTGCGIASMPSIVAEERGIPLPGKNEITRINVRTSTGTSLQRVRLGKIGVRVPGLASKTFSWGCHFVEPPHAPYQPLLGLEGVLNDLRLIFDGTHSQEYPYGVLIVEAR